MDITISFIPTWVTIVGLIISFLAAVGTISLALFAFRNIRNIRKENRQKTLDEVIEWAKAIRDWKFDDEDEKDLEVASSKRATTWLILNKHIEILDNLVRSGNVLRYAVGRHKEFILEGRLVALLKVMGMQKYCLADATIAVKNMTNKYTPPQFTKKMSESAQLSTTMVTIAKEIIDIASIVKQQLT